MLKNIYSVKKHKKLLSSIVLARNIEFTNILLISGPLKKNLKVEKNSAHRFVRSGFTNFLPEVGIEKNYLVKVENYIYCFNSCEKFDLLIKSKTKLSISSIYYKKFIFNNRKILIDNNLFWIFIEIKLLSILLLK